MPRHPGFGQKSRSRGVVKAKTQSQVTEGRKGTPQPGVPAAKRPAAKRPSR